MSAVQVLAPGSLTTIQDWPGRTGYWDVGVPPSGPMDSRSHRIGNRMLGNASSAAGLEATLIGPKLRFLVDAAVVVTGAPLAVSLDGVAVPQWTALEVPAGAVLSLGTIRGVGLRAYVMIGGGIAGTPEMGSRAVFAPACLGGEPLRRGDILELVAGTSKAPCATPAVEPPPFSNDVCLRVVLGPHGAPDFLTSGGLDELMQATWVVDPQSNRAGVRLLGPQPGWSRTDGGEAGLHPSNILDSAYALGTVMLAGDMAVIVGPDGPSLGGFAAIAHVVRADLWRLGQLRAGDRVTLQPVAAGEAAVMYASFEAEIEASSDAARPLLRRAPSSDGDVVFDCRNEGAHGTITYRRAGEGAVLVEFGEPVLDLRSRVRAQALRTALQQASLRGVLDITPGVRSLHVQYDPDALLAERLVEELLRLEASLPAPEDAPIPGRTVHLPLSWGHGEVVDAVRRYESSVRADAPWCPDNVDFIRRMNGLPDERAVREIVTSAAYLVLGLGDVYMGAPVAVPLDPRHRLVTTKYNPPRTWTPANAVGIGGAFLCVYGVEGPGGYQLVGRTAPVWSRRDDPPWRLRHFDQLRFELVEEQELEELRTLSEEGAWAPRTEPTCFSLVEHERFLRANAEDIAAFTARRDDAFAEERNAWAAARAGTAGVAA
jgi:urea carboxylase